MTVDAKAYVARQTAKVRAKRAKVVTDLRVGPWTDAEDAIVVQTDIFLVEKMAILQRSEGDIRERITKVVNGIEVRCENCGKSFMSRSGVSQLPRRYCSIACRQAACRTLTPIPCVNCQKFFKPGNASIRFCSKNCVRESRRLPPIACSYCQEIFTPRSSRLRHCSRSCAVGSRKLKPVLCAHCQSVFKPRTTAARFCSKQCGWANLSVKPQKTHCKYGHEFTPENTKMVRNPNRKNMARACRACQRRKANEVNLRARERGRTSRTEAQRARDARVVRWAELGKTWEAVVVMAAEAGIDKVAMRKWLIQCGETVPDGRAHTPLRFTTHCRRGHERTPESTTIIRSGAYAGTRCCGVCAQKNRARRRAAKAVSA